MSDHSTLAAISFSPASAVRARHLSPAPYISIVQFRALLNIYQRVLVRHLVACTQAPTVPWHHLLLDMAGTSKRTRSATADEENAPPTPPPTGSRPTRRAPSQHAGPSTPTLATATPPTPTSNTPTRPIQTRSSTFNLAPPTPLTRTSSLFTASTRRANGAGLEQNPTQQGLVAGPSSSTRGGTLIRTQSTPTLSSPQNLKMGASGIPAGPGRGKGDPDDVFGTGSRRFGKGKENIPPKKDAENGDAESSRKRLRVGSRSSFGGSGRGRSGSVASVRSESSGTRPLSSRTMYLLLTWQALRYLADQPLQLSPRPPHHLRSLLPPRSTRSAR